MRFTTIQTNLLILALILALLQAGIIFILEFNGGDGVLADAIANKDATIVGLVFSPTGGIVWALKNAASHYKQE